ncbi:MAG: hypothetical protein INR69_24180, partial [Mucilaginibacter polytrichastri]|nr:hypothetical protein [Mucilaginibacter polytrichastri]
PAVLVKDTKLSCYNAGRDAQKIPFYTAVEEVILSRATPKLIILDVLPYELVTDNAKYERLTILLPYCKNHPELISYIKEVSPFEPYKLFSQTYPFNSALFISLYNHLLEKKVEDTERGYQALTHVLTPEEMLDLSGRMKLYEAKSGDYGSEKFMDRKSVVYYERFLENARKKGIKTVVCISPSLFTEQETFIKKKLKEVAEKYPNVSFVDYSNDPKYQGRRELFSDQFHLNATGAHMFSEQMHQYLTERSLLK